MKQHLNSIIFSIIVVTTTVLIVLGFVFAKSEEERINWLAESYDVSHIGDLVFVKYNMGKPEMYIKSENQVQFIVSLSDDTEVLDLTFTPDSNGVVLSTTNRNSDELFTEVSIFHLDTFEMDSLFEVEALITEIQFDPKDDQKLYYLMARTYESYSTIAQAHPHDFDVFHVDLTTKEHFTHSNLHQYSMRSLQVSEEKESIYVQMDDDFLVESAEEIFETKQRIFELSLDTAEGFTVVTDLEREVDVFDFALVPDEDAFVFQSIANYHTGGTFEYELFYYDKETKEETQLTNLASYVGKPVISQSDNKIYFIVNENFGKSNIPARKIYSMDVNGENIEQVDIQVID